MAEEPVFLEEVRAERGQVAARSQPVEDEGVEVPLAERALQQPPRLLRWHLVQQPLGVPQRHEGALQTRTGSIVSGGMGADFDVFQNVIVE